MSNDNEPWTIHDNKGDQWSVERGDLKRENHEVAAVVWDYALARVIQAVLNLQSRSSALPPASR